MSNLKFTVDKEKCLKCGLCQKDCSCGIITTDLQNYPEIQEHSEKFCMQCQHCFAICPTGAISILGKNVENVENTQNNINSDDMMNLIKTRRSCRQYKHETISQEKLEKLKEMLSYIPTGCNYRGLHYSIVETVEKMDEIRLQLNKKLQSYLKIMPVTGILKKLKKQILNGNDVIFRNAPHMIVVSVDKKAPCKDIDPIIALSYFELYAQTLGLGTLWCGLAFGTLPIDKNIMKMLNIPKTHKFSYVMLFGEPKISFARSIQPDKAKITTVK